jgi:hypothetical protein
MKFKNKRKSVRMVLSVIIAVVFVMLSLSSITNVSNSTQAEKYTSYVSVASQYKFTQMNFHVSNLSLAQHILKFEFYSWYSNRGFVYGPINNMTGSSIFAMFLKSNLLYQKQLDNIANLETQNALLTDHSSIATFQIPLGNSNLNRSADPYISFNIIPITLPWYLGGLTVGYNYYYYVVYTGSNALYYYQDVSSELSQANLGVSLSFGFGAGMGAAVIAGIITAAAAASVIGLVLGAVAAIASYAILSSEIATLNSAFDSTYQTHNYFETLTQQTVFLDGVSNAIQVYAWNANTESFHTIFGPFPELPGANYLNSFDSMVQNGVNDYGSMNWHYVSQTLSPS